LLASFDVPPSPFRPGIAKRAGNPIQGFSPLLRDLPPELEIPDKALFTALYHLHRTGDGGRQSRAFEPGPAAIRSLGDIYEALAGGSSQAKRLKARGGIGRSRRKATGMYYTPDAIVGHIVSGTLGRLVGANRSGITPASGPLPVREILGLRILDPASGAGHFLIAAAEYLAQACIAALVGEGRMGDAEQERSDAVSEYRRIVTGRCIYGVDIDPVAVELAGLSLWLYASDPGASLSHVFAHLNCGVSLDSLDWAREFPDAERGFDAVIGNPPYVSFSGRQKPPAADWMEGLIGKDRNAGDDKPDGWISMHGFFMLKSLELAKPSGLVSMVVPDQVGHLKGYEPLRRRMLEEGHLVEVRYWGEDVFESVTSPALTFIVRKSQVAGINACKCTARPLVPEEDRPVEETVIIDRDGNAIRFSPFPGEEWFTSEARDIARHMSGIHITVAGFSDPGVHTGNVARKLVLKQPASGSVPLLEGRQIHPFRCDEPKRWLDLSYRPAKDEYFRVSGGDTYRDTDIILRQTASRPVAARHIHRCHFRNSVLALRAGNEMSVEYLLGILNSEAAAYLYRALSYESQQRSFPQIKVGLLRSLPVPDPVLRKNRSRAGEIEDIVRRIEAIENHEGIEIGKAIENHEGIEIGKATDKCEAMGDSGETPQVRVPGSISGRMSGLVTRLENLAWSLYGFKEPPPGL
jgi:hypothetical protein